MYSKSKGIIYQQAVPTPPPGYDGSRFRGRSDGRDDTFPLYESNTAPRRIFQSPAQENRHQEAKDEGIYCEECSCAGECEEHEKTDCKEVKSSPMSILAPILKSIGKEELLIIALIILLAGEHGKPDTDTILLLAILLCAG